MFGAKGLALKGADALKLDADLAEALVGLTIVAVGTSLPELVTSVIAAKRRKRNRSGQRYRQQSVQYAIRYGYCRNG